MSLLRFSISKSLRLQQKLKCQEGENELPRTIDMAQLEKTIWIIFM